MDPAIWETYVRQVLSANGYECTRVSPGFPGTFPTFIAQLAPGIDRFPSQSMVIKFFGPLFAGKTSFLVERSLGYCLMQHALCIRSPALLAEGRLNEDWSYLVFEHIPGVSIGQVRNCLSESSMLGVARQTGQFMKELHALRIEDNHDILSELLPASWHMFTEFLGNQRLNCLNNHLGWGDLPGDLAQQLPGFLVPVDELVERAAPAHLVHADLTGDHLLGRLLPSVARSADSLTPCSSPLTVDDWESLAVIDWGDSRVGNILYELSALHIDLFRGKKYLLRACLESYGLPDFYHKDFNRKALSMLLLHQFPLPAWISQTFQDARTLTELADRLFGI